MISRKRMVCLAAAIIRMSWALLFGCSSNSSSPTYQAVSVPPPGTANRLYYYTTDIAPLMKASCVECHMPGMEMGGLTLDTYSLPGMDHHTNLDRWIEAYNAIRPYGDMPYGAYPVPTSSQLAIIKAWLDQGIPESPPGNSPSPTPSPVPSPSPTSTPTPTPVPPTPTPAPNQAPQMPSMSVSVISNTPTSFFLWASDPNGDPLIFVVTQKPKYGSLTGVPPKLTYAPKSGFQGKDFINVMVRDPAGAQANGTVQFQVAPKSKR